MVCRGFAVRLCVLALEQEGTEHGRRYSDEVTVESRSRALEYAAVYFNSYAS